MLKTKSIFDTITLSAFALTLAVATPALSETPGQYIDDASITTKVKAAIVGDSQLKDTSISVETDKGSVQLTGTVTSKAQETEVVHTASQVNGARIVQDHLTIHDTQSQ